MQGLFSHLIIWRCVPILGLMIQKAEVWKGCEAIKCEQKTLFNKKAKFVHILLAMKWIYLTKYIVSMCYMSHVDDRWA